MPAKGRVTRKYTDDEVRRVLDDVDAGMTLRDTAEKYGIPGGTVDGWVRRRARQQLGSVIQTKEPVHHSASPEQLRNEVLGVAEELLELASSLTTGADHLRYLVPLEDSLKQVASLSSHARGLEQRVKELENRVFRSAAAIYSKE